ncbi:hypothetical protein ACFONN_08075 [Dyella humi]
MAESVKEVTMAAKILLRDVKRLPEFGTNPPCAPFGADAFFI